VALIEKTEESVANGAMPNQSRYFAQTTPVTLLIVEGPEQTENDKSTVCSLFDFIDTDLALWPSVQAHNLIHARVYARKRYNSMSMQIIHQTR